MGDIVMYIMFIFSIIKYYTYYFTEDKHNVHKYIAHSLNDKHYHFIVS